ncbi:MAG: thioesterase [Bacteroidales bacterium]|nr:thioesterase [Bacteroidales bacterium]
MRKVARYDYKVQPMDVGFNQNIRFTQMGGYLLHTAGENAKENGFGINVLHAQDQAWVLSRMAIEMYRYPLAEENFQIETWIEDFGRVFTTRNFKILDASGALIGAASSIWCMLDMNARKAMDLKLKSEYAGFATGIASLIEKPIRVEGVEGASVSRHRIKYSDIDFNRHTNSMKYLEWMMDLFPLEVFSHQKVRRMDINYINEALFGEVVEIYQDFTQTNKCLFDLRRGEDLICRAQILFENDI